MRVRFSPTRRSSQRMGPEPHQHPTDRKTEASPALERPRTHSPDLERASRSLVLTAERRWRRRNCTGKPSTGPGPHPPGWPQDSVGATPWGPDPQSGKPVVGTPADQDRTAPPISGSSSTTTRFPETVAQPCVVSTTIHMAREPGRGPLHGDAGRSPRCEGPETPTWGRSCGRSPSLF